MQKFMPDQKITAVRYIETPRAKGTRRISNTSGHTPVHSLPSTALTSLFNSLSALFILWARPLSSHKLLSSVTVTLQYCATVPFAQPPSMSMPPLDTSIEMQESTIATNGSNQALSPTSELTTVHPSLHPNRAGAMGSDTWNPREAAETAVGLAKRISMSSSGHNETSADREQALKRFKAATDEGTLAANSIWGATDLGSLQQQHQQRQTLHQEPWMSLQSQAGTLRQQSHEQHEQHMRLVEQRQQQQLLNMLLAGKGGAGPGHMGSNQQSQHQLNYMRSQGTYMGSGASSDGAGGTDMNSAFQLINQQQQKQNFALSSQQSQPDQSSAFTLESLLTHSASASHPILLGSQSRVDDILQAAQQSRRDSGDGSNMALQQQQLLLQQQQQLALQQQQYMQQQTQQHQPGSFRSNFHASSLMAAGMAASAASASSLLGIPTGAVYNSIGNFGTGISDDQQQQQPLTTALSMFQEAGPSRSSPAVPLSLRPRFPLGIDEDENWLSEFHCFVRSELVEVYRAGDEECKARYNSISHQQVGVRCRFCVHAVSSTRAGRASAFPTQLRQIYQSFTMMLRDHFPKCEFMPPDVRAKFMVLKDKPSQGATDSKRYWIYSAMKLGMTDSRSGMILTPATVAAAAELPPFGTSPEQRWGDESVRNEVIVTPSQQHTTKPFLYFLLLQTRMVKLTEAERIGNRRSLRLGLPGLGCRYCADRNRMGLCRIFPARRRTLPAKMNDLHDHFKRCPLCPPEVKAHLDELRLEVSMEGLVDDGSEKEFFNLLWSRLGHTSGSATNEDDSQTEEQSRLVASANPGSAEP
jgi:hypothetical protein